MHRVEQLLRESIGLDATSLGSSLIERTVRLRMKSHGLKRLEEYLKLLQSSEAERSELIEAVVVTETWFFRDREPFRALSRLAVEEWLPAHPFRLLRLLSLPCSSGEEPYSMAMALLDAGFPHDRFQIDALDISARALERARRAVFGNNSFRGKDLEFRERYFQPSREGYRLSPGVCERVNFQHGNVLDEDCLRDSGIYDFIFCRNMLIYFDCLTRQKVVKKLDLLLTPKGLCFVGAAELPLVLSNGFVPARIPMAFACRRGDGVPPGGRARRRRPPKVGPGKTIGQPATRSQSLQAGWASGPEDGSAGVLECRNPAESASHHSTTPPLHQAIPPASPPAMPELETARRLADEGRLSEATEICEAHLRACGPSAEGFYLLGLVLDAAGRTEAAMALYRKALYLEPNHCAALLQLALLSEKTGDRAQARILKRRARRAEKRTRPHATAADRPACAGQSAAGRPATVAKAGVAEP